MKKALLGPEELLRIPQGFFKKEQDFYLENKEQLICCLRSLFRVPVYLIFVAVKFFAWC